MQWGSAPQESKNINTYGMSLQVFSFYKRHLVTVVVVVAYSLVSTLETYNYPKR
jgi:hypothetical protein